MPDGLRIDLGRLRQDIEALAAIGRDPSGESKARFLPSLQDRRQSGWRVSSPCRAAGPAAA
jgi:hypothetical protein